jgi:hypothetical protein
VSSTAKAVGGGVIRLDAATVLLQWSTGGLFFLWVTTRRREVGIGYGWLLRSIYAVTAIGAAFAGRRWQPVAGRDVCSLLVAACATAVLLISIRRRRAGLQGAGSFVPAFDLVAPAIGAAGLGVAGWAAGGPHLLAVARTLVGAGFLGAVTDAMLLGHWYLVQPGLGRAPVRELVTAVIFLWPFEIAVLLWPPGMASVLKGTIDDGWHGTLGWFWLGCALGTIVLAFLTRAALTEKSYSAVMAATGMLYLAILTAFGTDLVARAILAG